MKLNESDWNRQRRTSVISNIDGVKRQARPKAASVSENTATIEEIIRAQ